MKPMDTGFLESARKQFAYYKLLGDKTFAQLRDDELHWQYNADTNSVATIVKHLWGNMLSRWTDLLTTDGEKAWRRRDAEFDAELIDRQAMLARWEEGWARLFNAMDALTEADLGRIVYIRNQGHTVMEAINRQLAHYPYHVGQIVHIGKMLRGEDWQSLSVPRGKSAEYNAEKFGQPKQRGHFTDGLIGHVQTVAVLKEDLRRAHEQLWATVEGLEESQLITAPAGKWNALQHAAHIHLGVKAMANYLLLPKDVIMEKFGRMDRASMDMATLTQKYHDRLALGVTPPDRFMPPGLSISDKERTIMEGRKNLTAMAGALDTWGEKDLDAYMCPHPALGPLTAREMVMFTSLHADHHRKGIERLVRH